MNTIYRLSLFILILATCIGCDQTTKTIARMSLADARPISFFNNTVRFEYAENHGGFLSLGSTLPENVRFFFLTTMTTLVMTAVLFFTLSARHLRIVQLLGLTFISAGGFGNLIDRFLNHGAVIDFVSVGIGSIRTGIFNLADVIILTGAIVFIASTVFRIHASRSTAVRL